MAPGRRLRSWRRDLVAIVTNDGLANVIAAWNAYASRPLYFQFGTGSGQGIGDTDLAAAVGTRAEGATEVDTANVAGDTLKINGTITALASNTITEVGVFDADADGDMDIYGDFTGINLAEGDAIVFAISITVS
jgi:hypothetical protein